MAVGAAVLALALAAYLWRPGGGGENVSRTVVPAVTWPTSEWNARVSPDGRWLSFLSNRENQSRIFVQAIEGADPVPVTIQGAALSHAWSPDSRELAALVRQGDRRFLMVVPAFFGGSPQVSIPLDRGLTDITVLRWIGKQVYLDVNRGQPGRALLHVSLASGEVNDLTARWTNVPPYRNIDVSPDGTRVVIAASVGPRSDLWTAAIDGSDLQRLTDDDHADRYPVWTSPGAIVFESNRGGQLDLWQWSSSRGRLTSLTSSPTSETVTGASADGATIAFEQTSISASLWRLDFTAGGGTSGRPGEPVLRQLTADALSDYWPSASSDDRVLAFQRAKPTLMEGFQFLDARVLVAPMQPDPPVDPQNVADGFSVRLSADGRWAAFYQRVPDRRHLRLSARNLSTGESRTLSDRCVLPHLSATSLPVDFLEQNVTWSAAGERLFYVAAGDGGHEIHTVDLETSGGPARLVSVPAGQEVSDVRLAPDGSALAFLVRIKKSGSEAPASELHVYDLTTNRTRVVAREPEAQPFLYLPGWSRDAALLMVRPAPRVDGLYELELIELALDGTRRRLATVPDSVIPAVRIDAARGRLFVTRSVEGIHNIHAMSLHDGSMRAVTSNQSPGVSFSGILPLRADAVIFARDERKRDIWLATARYDR
jgi:Tol biopolymer transport system component